MKATNVVYKWSKIFAARRFGGKPMTLTESEQQEILDDIQDIGKEHDRVNSAKDFIAKLKSI